MTILLQDSIGNTWSVSATSGGLLTSTLGDGPPMILYLAAPNTSVWQLGVNTFGELTTTPVSTAVQPQYSFIGVGTTTIWSLSVTNSGLLQTNQRYDNAGWLPNGGGAGADNSVVGGGGGFMAYPQPPTGPRAGLRPVENNLQAGPLSFTINDGKGLFSIIQNPGRNVNS